jgi:hypothetical protein
MLIEKIFETETEKRNEEEEGHDVSTVERVGVARRLQEEPVNLVIAEMAEMESATT